MGKRVKIIENVSEGDLKPLIAVHKNDGAQVGFKKEENGTYTIEAVFEDAGEAAPQQSDTVKSEVSDERLTPG